MYCGVNKLTRMCMQRDALLVGLCTLTQSGSCGRDFLVFIDFLMSFFVGYYVDKKIHVARDDELAPEESILDGSADRVAHRQVVTRSASMTAKYYVFGPRESNEAHCSESIVLVHIAAHCELC